MMAMRSTMTLARLLTRARLHRCPLERYHLSLTPFDQHTPNITAAGHHQRRRVVPLCSPGWTVALPLTFPQPLPSCPLCLLLCLSLLIPSRHPYPYPSRPQVHSHHPYLCVHPCSLQLHRS